MESGRPGPVPSDYQELLARYLRTHDEQALYQVSRTSQTCIESGLGPEDIIALHFEALDRVVANSSLRDRARLHVEAQEVLLEMMIAYGVKYKEFLDLKVSEAVRHAEAGMAQERDRAIAAERRRSQKDELLGVIAHELRTPLTAAKGNLDLVSRRLSRGDVESLPTLLTQMREALERLSRLTADLVEASRGELPRLVLERLELAPIINQACRWIQPAALSKGITLVIEPGNLRHPILGNTDAVLSILGNLLSNAVRYTPAGGSVWLRTRDVGGWMLVEVQDNGIGIAPDVQSRIFEKFYRTPEGRQMECHGLGLGLNLVQQMVHALHGKIDVESELKRGSTFRVLLPVAPDDGRPGPTADSTQCGPNLASSEGTIPAPAPFT